MEENIYTEILQRLVKIETKIDNIEKIKDDVDSLKGKIIELQAKDESQAKEIKELKDTNKWLIRTIAGEVIGIVIAVIIAAIAMGFGA